MKDTQTLSKAAVLARRARQKKRREQMENKRRDREHLARLIEAERERKRFQQKEKFRQVLEQKLMSIEATKEKQRKREERRHISLRLMRLENEERARRAFQEKEQERELAGKRKANKEVSKRRSPRSPRRPVSALSVEEQGMAIVAKAIEQRKKLEEVRLQELQQQTRKFMKTKVAGKGTKYEDEQTRKICRDDSHNWTLMRTGSAEKLCCAICNFQTPACSVCGHPVAVVANLSAAGTSRSSKIGKSLQQDPDSTTSQVCEWCQSSPLPRYNPASIAPSSAANSRHDLDKLKEDQS